MLVCEIFKSIQGESSFAGQTCSFVRLTGCNLDCSWCDTKYAFTEGNERSIDNIVSEVNEHKCELVEITGGEPLLQSEAAELCRRFIEANKTVLVETNGSKDISVLPKECIRIVDVKCPGSAQENSFLFGNLNYLTNKDELKFVIADKVDFDWAIAFVKKHELVGKCVVHFSPVMSTIKPADLVQMIMESGIPVRLGIQLHKIIWGDKRGV